MNKERFNQIIDLIIENVDKSVLPGICISVRSLKFYDIITNNEYTEIKSIIDPIFDKMINEDPTYNAEGIPSEHFIYLFPNNEERIKFLNQLKEQYEDSRTNN